MPSQEVDAWYSSLPIDGLLALKRRVLGGMDGAFVANRWTEQVRVHGSYRLQPMHCSLHATTCAQTIARRQAQPAIVCHSRDALGSTARQAHEREAI